MGFGEILSLLCAFLWAFAVIFYKRAGDHLTAYEMNLFKSVFVFILMIPTVVFSQFFVDHGDLSEIEYILLFNLEIPIFSAFQFGLVFISGIIGIMLADLFYLRALQLIGASLTGITGSLYSPFVVGLSMLYLNESLNGIQYIGMVLVLSGVVLVGYRKKSVNSSHPPIKGFVYAMLAVFFTALGIVLIKPISSQQPFFWIILIRSLGGMVGMIIYGLVLKKSLTMSHIIKVKGGGWLILGAFIGQYVSMMIWVAGYKYTSASVASILNETASVFILILSWLMLGEKLTPKKILGVGITVGGVLLVLNIFH